LSWSVTLSAGLALLLVTLLTGVPIFVAFLLLNIGAVGALFGSAGFGLFSNSMLSTAVSATLVPIPLFVLMGEVLFRSGSVEVAFNSVDTLVGRVRGRLYVFTTALSVLFGALSGSAAAVVAMLGRSVLPTMVRRKYDVQLSATVIMGGASLAPIIPPSLLAVVIGSIADVSIARLLIAGVVPGVVLAGLIIGWVYLRLWRDPSLAPPETDDQPAPAPGEKLRAALRMAPFGFIIFSVMGLILLGVATPSEAAATGVTGALLTAAIYRRLTWRMFWESALSAASISTLLLIIVASAVLFSQLLAFTGATAGLVSLVTGVDLHPVVMLTMLMLIPFFICMFMDQFAFMMIAVPIYEPIIKALHFDPVWFWALFLINLTVGSVTPPFGYTMFALRGAAQDAMSMSQVFRAAWPVAGIFVFGIVIFAAFPPLVTALPNLIK
jgi:tripartite ATP-independent transporter DctM subunit